MDLTDKKTINLIKIYANINGLDFLNNNELKTKFGTNISLEELISSSKFEGFIDGLEGRQHAFLALYSPLSASKYRESTDIYANTSLSFFTNAFEYNWQYWLARAYKNLTN